MTRKRKTLNWRCRGLAMRQRACSNRYRKTCSRRRTAKARRRWRLGSRMMELNLYVLCHAFCVPCAKRGSLLATVCPITQECLQARHIPRNEAVNNSTWHAMLKHDVRYQLGTQGYLRLLNLPSSALEHRRLLSESFRNSSA